LAGAEANTGLEAQFGIGLDELVTRLTVRTAGVIGRSFFAVVVPDLERRLDVWGDGMGTEDGMAEHRREDVGECVVVRRPGVVRLAETAMHLRGEAVLARRRGATMAELARTFSVEGISANVAMVEPDGAAWSMSVAAGGAPDTRDQDDGGEHGTRTRS
jgi:hypothetical protein